MSPLDRSGTEGGLAESAAQPALLTKDSLLEAMHAYAVRLNWAYGQEVAYDRAIRTCEVRCQRLPRRIKRSCSEPARQRLQERLVSARIQLSEAQAQKRDHQRQRGDLEFTHELGLVQALRGREIVFGVAGQNIVNHLRCIGNTPQQPSAPIDRMVIDSHCYDRHAELLFRVRAQAGGAWLDGRIPVLDLAVCLSTHPDHWTFADQSAPAEHSPAC